MSACPAAAKLPNSASVLSSVSAEVIGVGKVEGFLSDPRLTKSVDYWNVLQAASSSLVLHLMIPETLVLSPPLPPVFLYSDSSAVLRTTPGAQYNLHSALTHFLQVTSRLRQQVLNVTPQGLRYPKYLLLQGGGVVRTLFRKREAKSCEEGVLQRYVMPKDYVAKKVLVRWRRTKVTKVYSVTVRGGKVGKGRGEGDGGTQPPLDPSFLASLHLSPSTVIHREPRLPQSSESLIPTFKSLLESFVLGPSEQLEELILSLILAQDGKAYLLGCKGIRTTTKESVLKHNRRASMPTMDEIEQRITRHEQFTPALPRLKAISDSVKYSPDPSLTIDSPQLQDPTASLVSEHISTVAGSMDKLVGEAKTLKAAYEHFQRVRFSHYPPGFLLSCIHRLYATVSSDKQLLKYFGAAGEAMTRHIETSVSLVFEVGCSRHKVRGIHRKLKIADSDFGLYLKHFEEALKEGGAGGEDVEKAMAFLQGFKDVVVTRRRCSIVDMNPADYQ